MHPKTLHTLLLILLTTFLVACQEEEMDMTLRQQALLGRAVNFNVSVADKFAAPNSRYTSIDDGSFNENDRMRIYRNYWKTDGTGWESESSYRTYNLIHKYVNGNISLGIDWVPEAGRMGYDDLDGDGTYTEFVQTAQDSLTWENGRTLRFQAWSLSNFHNVLYNATQSYYYPDYCIAQWVNASGPTEGIPLVLNHQGSRIRFDVKQSGNQISRVEICAGVDANGNERPDAWKDYKYADNNDITDNDNSATEAGKSDAQAQLECDSVTAVYKRMCMPAGVDMQMGTLMGIKNSVWKNLSNDQVRRLEEQPASSFLVFGQPTAEEVENDGKRPFFCGINGRQYFITIPYDITQGEDKGNVFVLPACTRFRVYMYDVNNGDENETPGYEGKYHIFALSDVVVLGADNKPIKAFPNGLKMEAGVSYTFRVGYRYNGFYVVVDNNLSWANQDKEEAQGDNRYEDMPVSSTKDYQWWKTAIKTAIDEAGTRDYKPEFHIKDEKDFLEFIRLVNGTAATKTSGLYRLVKSYDASNNPIYGWSLTNSQFNPKWIS